ncbi:MAG TPA: endonuclease/exonuclease/phosphatase family protein [Lacibacter sp.]|nr:endonuclease/exonuclease/phosphatase family protein [Lacibacter sp.]HMO90168.1 endonuclease/exonuclease/phosphatase family protein [Lacibacter sp.]HMP86083.1 endonuclease/exonuclease/phosphatase family protein [Lacibacter sp.]
MTAPLRFLFVTLLATAAYQPATGQQHLTAVSFNIRYDNPADGAQAWPHRLPVVLRFLTREQPDLLGLQEVLHHQYMQLDSALPGYTSVAAGRTDGKIAGEMNPVFFRKDRFQLLQSNTFWLSETPGIAGSRAWGAGLPRIVTWVELLDRQRQRRLFFFNTHFAHDSEAARTRSAALLRRMVDSIAAGAPFFLTGDFNMPPTAEGYALLTQSPRLLHDSYVIAETPPQGPTDTFNGFSGQPHPGRIDYIFVSNGLRVLQHRTVYRKENGLFISDHWPVVAGVLVP